MPADRVRGDGLWHHADAAAIPTRWYGYNAMTDVATLTQVRAEPTPRRGRHPAERTTAGREAGVRNKKPDKASCQRFATSGTTPPSSTAGDRRAVHATRQLQEMRQRVQRRGRRLLPAVGAAALPPAAPPPPPPPPGLCTVTLDETAERTTTTVRPRAWVPRFSTAMNALGTGQPWPFPEQLTFCLSPTGRRASFTMPTRRPTSASAALSPRHSSRSTTTAQFRTMCASRDAAPTAVAAGVAAHTTAAAADAAAASPPPPSRRRRRRTTTTRAKTRSCRMQNAVMQNYRWCHDVIFAKYSTASRLHSA